jgi:hypothetical protein
LPRIDPDVVQEDGVKSLRTSAVRGTALSVTALFLFSACSLAQDTASAAPPPGAATASAVHDLQQQIRELRTMVDEMRSENAQSRAEMEQLRQELQTTRSLLERPAVSTSRPAVASSQSSAYGLGSAPPATETAAASAPPSQTSSSLEDRVQKLEDSTSLLGSKVDEQFQTKVETASKYRARLSGIVLMNAFRNHGASNNLDFPDFAQATAPGDPQASFGATLRQSEIGLEVFGPNVAGAKTSAEVQFDFAGGFPATGNGVNFGFVRLQTANLHFDWANSSVVIGQDSLFLSPLSPTSFASLATPTFAYGGNLWGWIPQLRYERRFNLSDRQTFTVQAGILDNLDWQYAPDPFYRSAQAGEQSGQPAYGVRTSWSRPVFDHPLSFGAAGYYGRQNWSWDRYVDSWAGMLDWQIPIARRVGLSGEFYRGRGIGGLGAGVGRAVLFGGDPTKGFTPIRGLNDIGGWSQLKIQLTNKVELNGVFADDNAYAGDVRGFATDDNNFGPILGRNRGMLGNIVYRPRSDLLFSTEFRRLRSFPVYSGSSVTNQVNLAMGILF